MDLDLKSILEDAGRLVARFGDEAYYVVLCVRSGLIGVELPHRVGLMLRAFDRFGTLGGAVSVAAIRGGGRVGLIDELGSLTFTELDRRSNALANAWHARGLEPGDGVAILARNHRGFLDATFAAAKCGTRIALLNTDSPGPHIRRIAAREGTDLLVYDDEFAKLAAGIEPRLGRWRAWADGGTADDTIESLIGSNPTTAPPKPGMPARILTSGTLSAPKRALRSERSLAPLGGVLSKVPLRANEMTECCVPLFDSLGFGQTLLAVGLGSTLVLRRSFDPATALESLDRHQATALVARPVMLGQMLDLGADARAGLDLDSLRIVCVGGSKLGAELCRRTVEVFGEVVYSVYGSMGLVYVAIATPEDLAAEPACVGRVVRGSVVKVTDARGTELPAGATGRIFVGSAARSDSSAGVATKKPTGGLAFSGDLGHFDDEGRLFVDGRDDEMIVSGGENVFPSEIEDLLAGHPAILEAAAIAVPDQELGQRLRAFVVVREGASLNEDELERYVREKRGNHTSPQEVVFVAGIPRNPSGKVLKRLLERLPVA